MVDLLAKEKLSPAEFILLLIVGGIALALLTYSDVINHDFYVLPIIGECFPDNQSDFCLKMRALHGLPSDAQITLGSAYWNLLQTQAIGIGAMLFILRIGFGYLATKKISGLLVLKGILWGGTFSLLFLFGWLDFGYYVMQNEPLPDQLPWLDQSGVFIFLKVMGTTDSVDLGDLYLGMLIGATIIVGIWLLFIYRWNKMKKAARKVGI